MAARMPSEASTASQTRQIAAGRFRPFAATPRHTCHIRHTLGSLRPFLAAEMRSAATAERCRSSARAEWARRLCPRLRAFWCLLPAAEPDHVQGARRPSRAYHLLRRLGAHTAPRPTHGAGEKPIVVAGTRLDVRSVWAHIRYRGS